MCSVEFRNLKTLTSPLDFIFLVITPYKDRFSQHSSATWTLLQTELLNHVDCCKNSPNPDRRIKAPPRPPLQRMYCIKMIGFFSRGTINSYRRKRTSRASFCGSPVWISSASLHTRIVVTLARMFLHCLVRQMWINLMDLLSISGRHYTSLRAYEYPHKALSFRSSFQPSDTQHKAPSPHQLRLT